MICDTVNVNNFKNVVKVEVRFLLKLAGSASEFHNF